MAIYHLNIRGISPARGASAIAAAAYQSGQILRDLATGEVCRYARQERVAETGIVLPDGAPAWAHDREALWNRAAEAWSEGSANRLMARRLVVALPRELSYPRMRECVERLCQTFAKDGHACDWAIHDAQSGNPHAHILISSNSMDAGGFVKAAVQKRLKLYICRRDGEERQIAAADWKSAKKAGWEKVFRYKVEDGSEIRFTQSEAAAHGLGNDDRVTKTPVSITAKADGGSILEDAKSDLVSLRASWAAIANAALDEQYKEDATPEILQSHIDHRSNAERGIEAAPTIHEGASVTAMERHAIDAGEPVAETRVREKNVQIHFHNYLIAKLRAQIVRLVARVAEARSRAVARVHAKSARARSFFLGVPSVMDVPAVLDVPPAIGISTAAPAVRIQEQEEQIQPQPPLARDAVRVLAKAGADIARAGAASAEAAADKLRDVKTDMNILGMDLASLGFGIKIARAEIESRRHIAEIGRRAQEAAEARQKASAKKTAVYLSAEEQKRLMELLGQRTPVPDAQPKPRAAQPKAEKPRPIVGPSQPGHQEAREAAGARQKSADAQKTEMPTQQETKRHEAARQSVSEAVVRAAEKARHEAAAAREQAARKAAEAAGRAQAEAAARAAEEYRRVQEALQQRDENQDQDYWEEPER